MKRWKCSLYCVLKEMHPTLKLLLSCSLCGRKYNGLNPPFATRSSPYPDFKTRLEGQCPRTSWAEVASSRNIVRVHCGIFAHIWAQCSVVDTTSGTNALTYYIVYMFHMAGLTGHNTDRHVGGTWGQSLKSYHCLLLSVHRHTCLYMGLSRTPTPLSSDHSIRNANYRT
ncbi:uncharacterized protein BCR38DRAFT_196341 [Pseudomassariella vexata]|uniref:Uncharacterized protein n=1 Tax=Pseudomassariella vexata TaxID=1141098 RepID=A0A1Y2E1K0_9PEZI|nr:uncharacterized protein BCR38DRAFT_196341 [Pseudomassariella vexata]ORY65379.1 hypothetical protein BCR38DRAFT_196341 [Pseudomassariella vexata]